MSRRNRTNLNGIGSRGEYWQSESPINRVARRSSDKNNQPDESSSEYDDADDENNQPDEISSEYDAADTLEYGSEGRNSLSSKVHPSNEGTPISVRLMEDLFRTGHPAPKNKIGEILPEQLPTVRIYKSAHSGRGRRVFTPKRMSAGSSEGSLASKISVKRKLFVEQTGDTYLQSKGVGEGTDQDLVELNVSPGSEILEKIKKLFRHDRGSRHTLSSRKFDSEGREISLSFDAGLSRYEIKEEGVTYVISNNSSGANPNSDQEPSPVEDKLKKILTELLEIESQSNDSTNSTAKLWLGKAREGLAKKAGTTDKIREISKIALGEKYGECIAGQFTISRVKDGDQTTTTLSTSSGSIVLKDGEPDSSSVVTHDMDILLLKEAETKFSNDRLKIFNGLKRVVSKYDRSVCIGDDVECTNLIDLKLKRNELHTVISAKIAKNAEMISKRTAARWIVPKDCSVKVSEENTERLIELDGEKYVIKDEKLYSRVDGEVDAPVIDLGILIKIDRKVLTARDSIRNPKFSFDDAKKESLAKVILDKYNLCQTDDSRPVGKDDDGYYSDMEGSEPRTGKIAEGPFTSISFDFTDDQNATVIYTKTSDGASEGRMEITLENGEITIPTSDDVIATGHLDLITKTIKEHSPENYHVDKYCGLKSKKMQELIDSHLKGSARGDFGR